MLPSYYYHYIPLLPVSPLSVLPYRKQSTGAHLPLPRSRSKSARCSPTLGTRSRPPRFIATMKSRWVWLIRPSSLRCRSPATCDFIGCRSEFVGSSSGSSTFAAYPTCRITSPSLCPWADIKSWPPSSLWIPLLHILVRDFLRRSLA